MTTSEKLKLQHTLRELEKQMSYVGRLDGYAIFGSASLVIRGILDREPGDIDVLVDRRVWGALLGRYEDGWFVETPKAGDPPILSNETYPIPIHMFYDWSDRAVWMDVPELIRSADWIEYGDRKYRVIPVRDALDHKTKALAYGSGNKKSDLHAKDIMEVQDWMMENEGIE